MQVSVALLTVHSCRRLAYKTRPARHLRVDVDGFEVANTQQCHSCQGERETCVTSASLELAKLDLVDLEAVSPKLHTNG